VQDHKIVGGSQGVCDAMAKELSERVKLGHIVTRIQRSAADEEKSKFVTVHCRNGASFRAKRVLCTLPPTLYGTIRWEPRLSAGRRSVAQRMVMGPVFKVLVYYRTAWWRERGLNGTSFVVNDESADEADEPEPVVVTLDDCKPDGSFPALIGIIHSNEARFFSRMDRDARQASVIRQFVRVFGDERARSEVVGYFEKAWHDEEFSGGGYSNTCGCGVMTSPHWPELRRADGGRVHFAGTELADAWMGYMDGAIQSGEREAHAIANFLAESDDRVQPKRIYGAEEEPQLEDFPLPSGDLTASWAERHIVPTARNAKRLLFLTGVVSVGVAFVARRALVARRV